MMAWIKARTRTRIRKYQEDRNGIKTDDKIDCYKTRIPLKTKTRTRNPRTRTSTRKTGPRPGPATLGPGLVPGNPDLYQARERDQNWQQYMMVWSKPESRGSGPEKD
jgi:hypothetical protein